MAKAELDFTEVRAQFDGIVDRQREQVGSLIKEGDILTTLSDNSVMWVYFNVPEKRYLEYMAEVGQNKESPEIELELANHSKFPHTGRIGAIEAKFNNETGNIQFRGGFSEPGGGSAAAAPPAAARSDRYRGDQPSFEKTPSSSLSGRNSRIWPSGTFMSSTKTTWCISAKSTPRTNWMTSMSSRRNLMCTTRSFSRESCRFATARRWNTSLFLRNRFSQTKKTRQNSNRFPVRKPSRKSYKTMYAKFLQRPALAIVISVLILFLGGLAINTLPISQFPSVAPPAVLVSVSYPGASAEVLVDSVLIILEQAINGVPDMRYMASAATSAGEGAIQIIFEPGTDPNVAVLNVNNRIQVVKNKAPSHRRARGNHRHSEYDEHADVCERLQYG